MIEEIRDSGLEIAESELDNSCLYYYKERIFGFFFIKGKRFPIGKYLNRKLVLAEAQQIVRHRVFYLVLGTGRSGNRIRLVSNPDVVLAVMNYGENLS